MTPATNWVPGVVALLVALSAGVFLLWWSRGGARLPAAPATRRYELDRQKDALYALLREMAATAPADPEPAWLAERDRLEHEAARVLRDLDQIGEEERAPTPRKPTFGDRNPRLVGALWGAGAMAFVAALVLGVQEYAKPRGQGGSMTGGQQASANASGDESGITPAQQAAIQAMEAEVAANPNDVDALNRLGHAYLHVRKLMESFQQAEKVNAIDPDNAEARTHQAIVLLAIGDSVTAVKALDRVLSTHPDAGEALAYRGALYYQAGDKEKAIATLEHAMTADPDLAPFVGPLLDEVKAGPAGGMAMAGGGSEGAGASGGGAPASGGGPFSGGGGAQASGPSPDDVSGTIAIDPAVAATVKPGDTIFLYARPPGVTAGPPTWVERLKVASLPMDFTIGPANAMMGGATPPQVAITARIDRDGNPTTHGPDDLEARSDALAPGAKGVTLTLAAAGP